MCVWRRHKTLHVCYRDHSKRLRIPEYPPHGNGHLGKLLQQNQSSPAVSVLVNTPTSLQTLKPGKDHLCVCTHCVSLVYTHHLCMYSLCTHWSHDRSITCVDKVIREPMSSELQHQTLTLQVTLHSTRDQREVAVLWANEVCCKIHFCCHLSCKYLIKQ